MSGDLECVSVRLCLKEILCDFLEFVFLQECVWWSRVRVRAIEYVVAGVCFGAGVRAGAGVGVIAGLCVGEGVMWGLECLFRGGELLCVGPEVCAVATVCFGEGV